MESNTARWLEAARRNRNAGAKSPGTWILALVALVAIPVAIAHGLATGSELQVIAVIAAILLGVAILFRPMLGLIIFVCLMYTRPEDSIPVLATLHLDLVVALLTALGGLIPVLMHKERLVFTPFLTMATMFFLVGAISGATHGNMTGALADFLRMLILMVLVVNLMRNRRQFNALFSTVIVCTVFLALNSIYLYFNGQALSRDGGFQMLATGIFNDPNDLAATLLGGLVLTLTRIVVAHRWAKLPYLALAGVLLYSLFLTNSRSGMIGLFAVVAGFLIAFSKRKIIAIVMAVAIIGTLMVATPGRMTNFDTQEDSANSRFVFWNNAFDYFKAEPLTGVGYQCFADLNYGHVAHNTFVQCFVELGFPGFFFWMGCIYYCFRRFPKPRSDEAMPEDAKMLLGTRLAVIGYLTAAFWISRTYDLVLYLFLALPIAQQIASSGGRDIMRLAPPEKLRDYGRIFMICMVMLAVIYVMARKLA